MIVTTRERVGNCFRPPLAVVDCDGRKSGQGSQVKDIDGISYASRLQLQFNGQECKDVCEDIST